MEQSFYTLLHACYLVYSNCRFVCIDVFDNGLYVLTFIIGLEINNFHGCKWISAYIYSSAILFHPSDVY